MAHNLRTIENELREFVGKFPVFSFRMEYNERKETLLVCYETEPEVSSNDRIWDELIGLKDFIEEIAGEGNVLFSHGETLFSVSDEATVISSITEEQDIITFTSKPLEVAIIEYPGLSKATYKTLDIDYSLAA